MMPALRLIGSNNDVIEFSPFGAGQFATLKKPSGFGIQTNEVRILEGAGEGGRLRFVRKGPQDRDIPIGVFGSGRAEIFANIRRLSNALRVTPGRRTPRLVFPAADGVEYETEVVLVAQTDIDPDALETRQLWLLTLRSPDPYWTAREAVSIPPLKAAGSGRFMRPRLGNLRVTSSQVLGDVLVENPGDMDSQLVWVVRGPVESATFTRADGRSFSLGAFDSSTTITVDTRTGLVTDQNGDDKYELLGTAPKLFPVAGGASVISVQVVDATPDTLVQGYFYPKVEVVF